MRPPAAFEIGRGFARINTDSYLNNTIFGEIYQASRRPSIARPTRCICTMLRAKHQKKAMNKHPAKSFIPCKIASADEHSSADDRYDAVLKAIH